MTTEAETKKRILIVDDNAAIAESLSALFKENGFDVSTASEPDEAFSIFSSEIFDLVVTELTITGEFSVIEFLKLIKTGFNIPVVVISDYGNIDLIIEAVHHGADDFVPKPLDEKYLVSLVKDAIDRSSGSVEGIEFDQLPFTVKFDLASDTEALVPLRNFILKNAEMLGLDGARVSSLWLCVRETVVNAIVHGNKEDANKRVALTISNTPREVDAAVADEGPGYRHARAADEKGHSDSLKKQGLSIIDALADNVRFNEKGNEITITILK